MAGLAATFSGAIWVAGWWILADGAAMAQLTDDYPVGAGIPVKFDWLIPSFLSTLGHLWYRENCLCTHHTTPNKTHHWRLNNK